MTGMVGPLGGLTVWWDELFTTPHTAPHTTPHTTPHRRMLPVNAVSITPHYFLIPTGLNPHGFSTVYLVYMVIGLVVGALIFISFLLWRSESLSPMRYKYEQILTLVKKKSGQSVYIYIIFDLATDNTFPRNRNF